LELIQIKKLAYIVFSKRLEALRSNHAIV